MKEKLKKVLALACLLGLLLWLFLPLSQTERQLIAHNDLEWMLFDYNRIDPKLFKNPVLKYVHGKEYFEWSYWENSDTITAGVRVSKFRFFSFFPVKGYFLGPDTLWDKVFYTDRNYEKPLYP